MCTFITRPALTFPPLSRSVWDWIVSRVSLLSTTVTASPMTPPVVSLPYKPSPFIACTQLLLLILLRRCRTYCYVTSVIAFRIIVIKTHWKEHSFKQGVAHPMLYLVLTPQKRNLHELRWKEKKEKNKKNAWLLQLSSNKALSYSVVVVNPNVHKIPRWFLFLRRPWNHL